VCICICKERDAKQQTMIAERKDIIAFFCINISFRERERDREREK